MLLFVSNYPRPPLSVINLQTVSACIMNTHTKLVQTTTTLMCSGFSYESHPVLIIFGSKLGQTGVS